MLEKTLDLVREYASHELPHYTDCVKCAFAEVDPVFLRPKYSDFFWHCASTVPGWLPQVVLANAEAESLGADKLLSLWRAVDYNESVEEQVLFHATDEARHSRLFVKLTDEVFPSVVNETFLHDVKKSLTKVERASLKKGISIGEPVLVDHLVQMNMGEIRTRLHMELIGPALSAFAPVEVRESVEGTLNGLAHDEIVHIGYIARILEEWCATGDRELVHTLYRDRLHDFDQFTIDQTEPALKTYSSGGFPDLLEI